MDADSASGDYEKALDLADDLDFNIEYIDLTEWYQSSPLINLIPPGHPREKIARGNIKCRLRMITHYHLSQLFSGVYLDTDDLSEEYMGFWTKHGDEGDVKVIQHLTKDEVYDLGEYLGVSQSILSAPPGDGLKVTASSAASDQLGMSYTHTDYIMSRFTLAGFDLNGKMSQLDTLAADDLIPELARETGQPEEKVEKVIRQALRTAYKRRYGDNVLHLLPSRTELGLPDFGTDEFNQTYLAAINASR
jgi:NAD+ synthetase